MPDFNLITRLEARRNQSETLEELLRHLAQKIQNRRGDLVSVDGLTPDTANAMLWPSCLHLDYDDSGEFILSAEFCATQDEQNQFIATYADPNSWQRRPLAEIVPLRQCISCICTNRVHQPEYLDRTGQTDVANRENIHSVCVTCILEPVEAELVLVDERCPTCRCTNRIHTQEYRSRRPETTDAVRHSACVDCVPVPVENDEIEVTGTIPPTVYPLCPGIDYVPGSCSCTCECHDGTRYRGASVSSHSDSCILDGANACTRRG